MASALTAPATLGNLRPRPPTPPRELSLLQTASELKPLRPTPISHLNLHTPPSAHSPASIHKSGSGTGRMGKRVVWSGRDEIHEAPKVPGQSSPAIPSSAQSKPPLKSILKPSASPVPIAPSALDGTGDNFNIIEMLDSSIKQLAGADRDSKIDAYTMLNRAIKASNNLPDRVALQDKMSLLTQFIQRDILSKNENGSLDSSLINQALMLLATFVQVSAIASLIPAEFAVFFIDHAIKTFEDPNTPKDVARHFMQVGHSQSFGPKVMTLDRVGRLVASLHNIEEHTKGKSIVMARILFYRKLIKQARNHMAVHADWLKDMFVDMLSTMKDIRTHAVYLGLDAGFMFQKGRQLTRKVLEILQTSNDEDQSYIEFYFQKLRDNIKDKDRPRLLHVPQILSVIALFLKCPLDRWEYYNPWLQLMQLSFNSSDWQTKHEANYAWNRYVYLSLKDLPLRDAQQTKKSLSVLVQPLLSQLRGKKGAQQAEESKNLRRTLIGGVCNLYYYALNQDPHRQNQESKKQLAPEVTWDVAVQPAISLLTDGAQAGHAEDSMQALRILASLLDVSTPTFWREDRIQEPQLVKPDELPSIEAKWIKRNSDRIFTAITPIVQEKFVDLANRDSLTYRLWQAVIKSVSLASAKEIKVSEDTAKWFGKSLGLLASIWKQGCAESDELHQTKFYQSTCNFIKIMVDNLGLLPWTECKLSASVADTFAPVTTPSQRPDKNKGIVRKPLHHLFTTLSTLPAGVSDDENFATFFQGAFEPFFIGKSDKVRLDLTRELLSLLPQNTLSPFALWALGSQAAQLSLSTSESNKLVPTSNAGTEYRDIVNCLCNGLTLHPNLPPATWLALYEPFAQKVRAAVGAPGLALAVIEPIAKLLETESRTNPDLTLTATQKLFESAELPRDRQALEAARRRLWGPIPPGVSKETSQDPFQHLYVAGNFQLKQCYDKLENQDANESVAALFKAVDAFLSRTYTRGLESLAKLKDGLSVWIQDEKVYKKLKGDSRLSVALNGLWTSICDRLVKYSNVSKIDFDAVEDLLAAGFKSNQPSIVAKTTETWNVIAKDEGNIECSNSLKSIVSSLCSRPEEVEAEQSTGGFGAQATSYPGSHHNNHTIELSTGTSHETSKAPAQQPAPAEKPQTSNRKRRYEAESTPEPSATRTSKRKLRTSSRASTSRLRHDDSQIQFQPIAASSSPLPAESQHLTERQQEIREKQRSNAALFPEMRTSSPSAGADASTAMNKEGSRAEEQEAQRETTPIRHTPERKSTYGELISSTPTPRRGQILMLEGANDPPSSPPEPRSNPLASQIQSRPKANGSMEDWDFSSPPASPVTSRQQVAQDVELPHVTLTNESPEPPSAANEEVAPKAPSKEPTPSPDFIPSSLPVSLPVAAATTRSTRAKSRAARASAAPFTPPPKQQRPNHPAEPSSSRDHDDEFVDAKTNQEPSSPVLPELPRVEDNAMETSYTFSQVADDSQLANLAVELEARDVNLPQLPLTVVPSSSPEKAPADQHGLEYAAGKANENEQEGAESQSQGAASVAASEVSIEDSQGKRKRKRKRSKAVGSQRKKRRSSEPSIVQIESAEKQDEPAPQASQPAVKSKPSTRARSTRRSARMQAKEQDVEEAETSQQQEVEPEVQPEVEVPVEAVQQTVEPTTQDVEQRQSSDRDTDEELMSQLYEESIAASESQSASREATEALATVEDSMDMVSPSDNHITIEVKQDVAELQEHEEAQQGEEHEALQEEEQAPANKADAIMARLRTGMEDLRSASLSRSEFNEIEDMLFDMKRELFEAERRGRQ